MEKYKKLFSNSITFAIGDMGSKVISFLLVPLYTYTLSTKDFGTVDIIVTTINLLLPIITLCIYEGVLRFVMDKEYAPKIIFGTALSYVISINLFLIISFLILICFVTVGHIYIYMLLLLFVQSIQIVLAQFTRGKEKVKLFAVNGILMTLIVAVLNIVFLVFLRLGVDGYFISLIITNLFSILFLIITGRYQEYFSFEIDPILFKKMILYSLPLIPNSTMWWLINGSTRYLILYFVGFSANGLFAVANKIPSIISILTNVFAQAWQLSAIDEHKASEEERSTFFSKTFDFYFQFLFLGASGILLVLKPLIGMVVQENYYASWTIVPFLLIGVVYQSFAAFLGTNYTAFMETKGMFTTSIYAGISSVVLGLVLIPFFGTVGASIAFAISFIIMWLARLLDTKKYVIIKIDIQKFILNNSIILIQSILLFFFSGYQLFLLEFSFFIILMILNRKVFSVLFKLLNRLFLQKKED